MIDGLATLDEDDEPSDDELREEYRAAGVDLDAWAAQLQARAEAGAQAVRERQARKRRTRLVVVAGGLCTVAAGATAAVVHAGLPLARSSTRSAVAKMHFEAPPADPAPPASADLEADAGRRAPSVKP
jgi:hypothetical protein